MKKIYPVFIVAAAIATALVSCNKVDEPTREKAPRNITFTAKVNGTRTVFGEKDSEGYPSLWTGNETVLVQCNGGDGYSATVTPSADGLSASFEVSSDLIPEKAEGFQFFAYSPKSAVSNLAQNKISIPATQSPATCNSVDEAAHILVGTSEVLNDRPEKVEMSFDHLLAYGKIALTNFPDDVTITSIAMETDMQITGTFDHNPVNGSLLGTSQLAAHKKVVIETNYLTGVNSEMSFWFAIAPVDLEGHTVTFTVYTTTGEFVKTVTFPAGKGNFQAGQVASFKLNFSGIEKHAIFTKASSSFITPGSLALIVGNYSGETFAMGTTQSSSDRNGIAVSIQDGTITDPDLNNCQLFEIIPDSDLSETLRLKCVNGAQRGKYLSTSYNFTSGNPCSYLISVNESSSEYTGKLATFSLSFSTYTRIKGNGPTSGSGSAAASYNYISCKKNSTKGAWFYCSNEGDTYNKYNNIYKLNGTGHGRHIFIK